MTEQEQTSFPNHFIPVDFDPFKEENVTLQQVESTEAQRELFTNIQFGGDTANIAYNESITMFLSGAINFAAMDFAVDQLCQHHQSLRVIFSSDGMFMNIAPEHSVRIRKMSTSPSEFDSTLESQRTEEVSTVFNLETEPLIRFVLISDGTINHALIITAHHIICDGWSLGILLQDLGRWYSHFCVNSLPKAEKADSFTEYATYLKAHEESENGIRNQKFWLQQFKDELPVIDLPTYVKRPPIRTYQANRIDRAIDADLYAALKTTAVKNGVSFVTFLVAAFESYIHRLTGLNDIIIALPSAGQSSTGLNRVIGHCVNLLLLRSSPKGEMPFNNFLHKRKSALFDSYEHQLFTLGTLMSHLHIKRDPSRIPVTPVSFNVDIGLTDQVFFHGMEFRMESNKRKAENFEFYINASGDQHQLILECSYNSNLFTGEMIQKRLDEFVTLLQDVSAAPEKQIGLLKATTNSDLQLMLNQWNATSVSYPRDSVLIELFENIVSEHSDKPALQYGSFIISYRELKEKVDRFSAYFQSKGLQPKDRVALLLERSPDMIAALFAALRCGAAYVPIDLTNPVHRVEYIINQSKSTFVVCDHAESATSLQNIEKLCINDIQGDYTFKTPDYDPEDIAYIIYTSGSTGLPKGVCVSNRSVVNYISWCLSYYFSEKVHPHFGLYSSLSFDLTVTSIFCPLLSGNSVTIFRQQADLLNILHDHFKADNLITSIKLTPAHILVLDNLNIVSDKIKIVIVGGEELLPGHISILRKINPNIEIYNEYGPTEATVGCVVKKIGSKDTFITIGNPIANTSCYILNAQLENVPIGSSGELYLSGDCLAKGYFDNDVLTVDRFVQDEFIPGRRMYKTGDVVYYMPNGEIVFQGRNDEQVKIRGYRIEIGEIQSALESVIQKEVVVTTQADGKNSSNIIAYTVDPEFFAYNVRADGIKKNLPQNQDYDSQRKEANRILNDKQSSNISILELGTKQCVFNESYTDHLNIFDPSLDVSKRFSSLPQYDCILVFNVSDLASNPTELHNLIQLLIEKLKQGGQILFLSVVSEASGLEQGELQIAAEYFYSHCKGHASISHVDILCDFSNPGKSFHAVLYKEPLTNHVQFINWNNFDEGEWSLKKIAEYLSSDNVQTLGLSSIAVDNPSEWQKSLDNFLHVSKQYHSRCNLYSSGETIDVAFYKSKDPLYFRNRLQNGKFEKAVHYILHDAGSNRYGAEETRIKDLLKKVLPEYMIPAAIIPIERLPLTSNGKIDKTSLPAYEVTRKASTTFSPPSNQMEELIYNIWISVIGVDDIGIYDNFFESGGHSLLAIKVISEIEKYTGKKLPATALFTAPTIHELARLIDQEKNQVSFKMILPLRASGSRLPLFCIHMHNGNSHRWARLLNYLDVEQPLYAIQPRALDPNQEAQHTIVEMAELYVQEMKKIQPHGPYRLFGLCFGGMVAFEMAQQLHRAGEKIDFLGFIDNYVPVFHHSSSGLKKKVNQFLHMSLEEKLSVAGKVKNKLMAKVSPFISSEATVSNVDSSEADLRMIHTRALLQYKPEKYDGKVHLFKTEEIYPDVNDEHLGWDDIALGGVEFIKIDGSSTDSVVTEEEHIELLAKSLIRFI